MNPNVVQLPVFDGRGEPETAGPSLSGLKSAEIALIERFVAGQCTIAEHRQLVGFLLGKPEWISWIAQRVNDNFESSHQGGPKGYFLRSAA